MVNSYLPGDPPPNEVRSWPMWEPMVAHGRQLISEALQARIGQPTSRLASITLLGISRRTKCGFSRPDCRDHSSRAGNGARSRNVGNCLQAEDDCTGGQSSGADALPVEA